MQLGVSDCISPAVTAKAAPADFDQLTCRFSQPWAVSDCNVLAELSSWRSIPQPETSRLSRPGLLGSSRRARWMQPFTFRPSRAGAACTSG